MPTTAFQQAAQKQDIAMFDYVDEVERVWRDFPGAQERIFFVDLCTGELVYPGPSAEKEELRHQLDKEANLAYWIKKRGGTDKNSCCLPMGDGSRIILLLMEKHPHDLVEKTAPVAQEITFVFDHEVGHAVIPNATYIDGDKNMAESIADAYAVIRHFQRYGADSSVIDALVQNRAFDFAFRESGYARAHFTSTVVEQILLQRYDIAWDELSPVETGAMARQFAFEYAMHPVRLDLMHREFWDLRNKDKALKNGEDLPLQALAEKVLTTDSFDIFKYGGAALKLCLDGQAVDFLLSGDYWDNVRRKLAEKRREFAAKPAVRSLTGFTFR